MSKFDKMRRVKRYERIPVEMSILEIKATFVRMTGTTLLMAELIYCTSLRSGEYDTLRVKDIDFAFTNFHIAMPVRVFTYR